MESEISQQIITINASIILVLFFSGFIIIQWFSGWSLIYSSFPVCRVPINFQLSLVQCQMPCLVWPTGRQTLEMQYSRAFGALLIKRERFRKNENPSILEGLIFILGCLIGARILPLCW
jgi:hypothetical protein